MTTKEEIINSLEPLFKEAKEKGLWFKGNSFLTDDIYFPPSEFRKNLNEGRFVWGPVKWVLIDPQTLITEKKNKIKSIEKEINHLIFLINLERNTNA